MRKLVFWTSRYRHTLFLSNTRVPHRKHAHSHFFEDLAMLWRRQEDSAPRRAAHGVSHGQPHTRPSTAEQRTLLQSLRNNSDDE